MTVADDLLKNDGQKFLEMMEQLAERRMQREEEAAVDVEEDSEDEDDEGDDEDEEDDYVLGVVHYGKTAEPIPRDFTAFDPEKFCRNFLGQFFGQFYRFLKHTEGQRCAPTVEIREAQATM